MRFSTWLRDPKRGFGVGQGVSQFRRWYARSTPCPDAVQIPLGRAQMSPNGPRENRQLAVLMSRTTRCREMFFDRNFSAKCRRHGRRVTAERMGAFEGAAKALGMLGNRWHPAMQASVIRSRVSGPMPGLCRQASRPATANFVVRRDGRSDAVNRKAEAHRGREQKRRASRFREVRERRRAAQGHSGIDMTGI